MAFTDPRKNVGYLELRKGMQVADFGAGSGHFSVAAAKLVGDEGKVYAVDIQKDLLPRVQNVAKSEQAGNIEVIWGDLEEKEGTKLPADSIDAVILSNILFQAERRHAVVEEAYRVLKSGGRALVIDWSDSFGGLGPRAEDVIKKDTARALFEEVGFTCKEELSDAGEHHYGMIFTKN